MVNGKTLSAAAQSICGFNWSAASGVITINGTALTNAGVNINGNYFKQATNTLALTINNDVMTNGTASTA